MNNTSILNLFSNEAKSAQKKKISWDGAELLIVKTQLGSLESSEPDCDINFATTRAKTTNKMGIISCHRMAIQYRNAL